MTRNSDGKGSNVTTLPGGDMLMYDSVYTFTISFVAANKWPLKLWDKAGRGFYNASDDEFVEIVADYVKHEGLTQVTLCDTYREHGSDISISRSGRDDS